MARKTLEQFEEKLQDYLEELKVAEYTRFNAVIQKVQRLLVSAINELGTDISELRRAQLNAFLRSVSTRQAKAMNEAIKQYNIRMESFAGYSYQIEASLLASIAGDVILNGARARAIYAAAVARPMGSTGDLLKPWVDGLTTNQVSIIEKTLRKAHVNKWTNQQTLQVLRGTKAKNYADGLMSRMGKQNATIIRTAMQHINQSARQVVWAENSDIVKGYRWVSTLDDRTSEECQELDGQVFPIDEGPLPPAHPNCRSTTVAELDDRFDILDEGATRSSEDGYVPMDMTYPEWLAEQES